MSLCKTNDPWGGAILNNLNKCLQNKATYQVSKASHLPPPPPPPRSTPPPSTVSDKKNFKYLPIGAYVEKYDLSAKKVKVNRRL